MSRESEDDLPPPDSFKFENDFIKHLSYGWFPQPTSARFVGYCGVINLYEWDKAGPLRSSSFAPTKFPFGTSDPFASGEDVIKKENSDESAGDDFPGTGYSSHGIFGMLNVPALSSIFRVSLSYDFNRERLYSLDDSRSFLAREGTLRSLKEVTVLFSNQHFLSASAGIMLPVYGVFFSGEPATAASFYYVFSDASASVNIINEATQYAQIANAKDQLRYRSAQDTVVLFRNAPLRSLNKTRYYLDAGVGWQLSFFSFTICSEFYTAFPVNSVLSDADWKQYRFGLRFWLGYDGWSK